MTNLSRCHCRSYVGVDVFTWRHRETGVDSGVCDGLTTLHGGWSALSSGQDNVQHLAHIPTPQEGCLPTPHVHRIILRSQGGPRNAPPQLLPNEFAGPWTRQLLIVDCATGIPPWSKVSVTLACAQSSAKRCAPGKLETVWTPYLLRRLTLDVDAQDDYEVQMSSTRSGWLGTLAGSIGEME